MIFNTYVCPTEMSTLRSKSIWWVSQNVYRGKCNKRKYIFYSKHDHSR